MADLASHFTVPPGRLHWQRSRFDIATGASPEDQRRKTIAGFEYAGLGLHPFSRRTWFVTHLATGHMVRGLMMVDAGTAFELADDLAAIVDWTAFSSLDGWRNAAPDLPDKMEAWDRRNRFVAAKGSGVRYGRTAAAISADRE